MTETTGTATGRQRVTSYPNRFNFGSRYDAIAPRRWEVKCVLIFSVLTGCEPFRQPESARSIHNYPPGDHEWILTTPDSVDLFIMEYGTGEDTVLVLHGGWGGEYAYLTEAFKGLYDRYHFIFYLQRGSLRSPVPEEKISIQAHIADIEAIREAFGMDRVNLFGHSNGATTATLYLREHPDRVRGFVMTASVQLQQPILESDSLLYGLARQGGRLFGEFLQRPGIQVQLDSVDDLTRLPAERREHMKERIRQASYYMYDITNWERGREPYGPFYSGEAARATAASVQPMIAGGYDFRSLYSRHQYPITIINGWYDMVDPGGEKFAYWTKSMPNVFHEVIDEAAHDAWIDQPEAFRAAFVRAMDRYYRE